MDQKLSSHNKGVKVTSLDFSIITKFLSLQKYIKNSKQYLFRPLAFKTEQKTHLNNISPSDFPKTSYSGTKTLK